MTPFARLLLFGLLAIGSLTFSLARAAPQEWSGIYPELAYFNNEGECGTGAVVAWADRLWAVSYTHLTLPTILRV